MASSKLSATALWSFLGEVDTTLAGFGMTELPVVRTLQARRVTLRRALMARALGSVQSLQVSILLYYSTSSADVIVYQAPWEDKSVKGGLPGRRSAV
ncbi:hypothetical protein ElyMa_001923600 [Elysia marginata]|uniref:Uncharacterized protein n=1 Tax=Elysia marginata TaxID=1093978 RepID=A0AAV4ETJ8_9GAST|nr:hypothetical protein ElyMa_001923600 [Elysia marginata]